MPCGLCEHGNGAHRGTAENALPPIQPRGPPSPLLRSYARVFEVCDLHRQVVECSHRAAPATKQHQARAQIRLFQGGSLRKNRGKQEWELWSIKTSAE